jgi:hypothetical protein
MDLAGVQPVTVIVFNAGSQASYTVSVDVRQTYFENYLPAIHSNPKFSLSLTP